MEELNCGFFNPNWENSMDQNDPFQSALSSIVSSPTANANNGSENIVLQELIGRLDSISNNTSLNSSPKQLNLSPIENHQIRPNFPSFPFSDLAFVDNASRFPFYNDLGEIGAKLDSGKISRVSSNHSVKILGSQEKTEINGSRDISSISEQIQTHPNSRKRKSLSKGKGKENPKSAIVKDTNVVGSESNESSPKRSKSDDDNKNGDSKSKDDNSKGSEPFKDYIHVRARRGQATDAHSLAERVRREKIGERMKFLQDLVPGCNKVTGKAVMLDEIINYVQSLQRQVEFLSMKLSTVNPRMELNMESLVSKDMFQSRGPYPSECYPFQSQPTLQSAGANGAEALNHFNTALGRNQLPPMNNCAENPSQASTFWENDLHNFVQMGYIQDQTRDFHGAQMKVEP